MVVLGITRAGIPATTANNHSLVRVTVGSAEDEGNCDLFEMNLSIKKLWWLH